MSAGQQLTEKHCSQRHYAWTVIAREPDSDTLALWAGFYAQLPEQPFYLHPTWLSALSDTLLNSPLIIVCAYFTPDGYADRSLTDPAVARLPDIMLPLVRSKRNTLTLPAHDHLTLGGGLINPTLTHHQIESALAKMIEVCDVTKIEFGNLPDDSILIRHLPTDTEPHSENASWLVNHARESAWFDLDGEDAVLPGKLRRNLKRLHRKLSSTGSIDVQCFTGEHAQAAFDSFLAVEASGWKGAEGTAIRTSPELVAFYRALQAPEFPGLVPMINQLTVDNQVIAVQYALSTGSCTYILKIGYLESYAQYAPGSLLLDSVITLAKAQGNTRLSLVTNPDWASRWHPRIQPVLRLACHRTQVSALGARTVRGLKETVKNLKSLAKASALTDKQPITNTQSATD